MKILLRCLAMTTLLSGCSGVVIGNAIVINESPKSVAQHVVVGKTRKADVEATYGTPTSKTYDSTGIETWIYGSTAAAYNGETTSHKSLQVQFGKDGIAIYYLLTDSDPQQRRQTTAVSP
jgi:outer membrane protein assembly factor BamE (lipoprotein component of BamABCDE complex)